MLFNSDTQTRFKRSFSPTDVPQNAYKDPADIILFMHIPKTAGMSVGASLKDAFDIFHPVSWENTAESFRQKTREALYIRTGEKPVRQVLMGHFAWRDVMFWKNHELPLKCATFIRDPLTRCISNYRYNCSDRHPQHAAFKARFPTVTDFARTLPRDYQLLQMCGLIYSFDHALEKLDSAYSFIGATEHLSAGLQHFSTSHGLDTTLKEHRKNTAKERGAASTEDTEITDELRNIVYEKSRNDLRLHQLICSYFE